MPIPLHRFPLATTWMGQFLNEDDRTAALLLLDSLDLVTGSEAERYVLESLNEIAEECNGPLAIFTLRKLTQKEVQNHYFGSKEKRAKTNTKPDKIEGIKFGSDGRAGHMTRDLAEGYPGRFLDHPSIDEMRQREVRKIVLIDDIVGSGSRVIKFVKHLYQNKTVRSWHSFDWIQFVVVSYAMTTKARNRLARLKKPDIIVRYSKGVGSLKDTGLKPEQLNQIRTTCRKFAKNSDYALGFDNTEATLVFDYVCPNNVPQMLWRAKGDYVPLFPEKTIPGGLRSAFGTPAMHSNAENRLKRLGENLAAGGLSFLPYDHMAIVLFLAAIGRRARRTVSLYHSLSIYTSLSIEDCRTLRTLCLNQGLITTNNKLTDSGYFELRRARALFHAQEPVDGARFPYYPKALRGMESV